MQPTILLRVPKADFSVIAVTLAFMSFEAILVLLSWTFFHAQNHPLHFFLIPVLVLFTVLYYPRRKVRRINAKYEEQRGSLPQQGDWRVLRRCTQADNEPTVRFIGYHYPPGGQHSAHDKKQWNPSLFDPAISSYGIPTATKAVSYCAATGAFAWVFSSIALFWLPPVGNAQMSFLAVLNTVSLVVVAASAFAWLVPSLVTTEVWFAPGLIRVRRTRAWRSKDVVTDFAVESGFVATLCHGRPDKLVWFRRFREVLRLENGRCSIEVSAAGLCVDDFWWAVTSDYRTTPEQMDSFLADGGR